MELSLIIFLSLLCCTVVAAPGGTKTYQGELETIMVNGVPWTGIVEYMYNNRGKGLRYTPAENELITQANGNGFTVEQCLELCIQHNCDSFNYCPQNCYKLTLFQTRNPLKEHAHCEILSAGFNDRGEVADGWHMGGGNYKHYVARHRRLVQPAQP